MLNLFIWQLIAGFIIIFAVILHRVQAIEFRLFALVFGVALLIWLLVAVMALLSSGLRVWQLGWSAIGLQQVLSLLLGLLVITFVVTTIAKVRAVPRIHDITTDWQNPPQFSAALALRQPHHNSLDVKNNVLEQQQAAYPEIKSLTLAQSPENVFLQAVKTAEQLGWHIHFQNPEQGIVEATVTSGLFGFVDDVVVRITPMDKGSQVDVRSASRLGQSDLGANARRIRDFLKIMKEYK